MPSLRDLRFTLLIRHFPAGLSNAAIPRLEFGIFSGTYFRDFFCEQPRRLSLRELFLELVVNLDLIARDHFIGLVRHANDRH